MVWVRKMYIPSVIFKQHLFGANNCIFTQTSDRRMEPFPQKTLERVEPFVGWP